MIKRVFNLLFGICSAWVLCLIWNWDLVTQTEGVGAIIVIALLPFGFVFILYYIVGSYRNLF